MMDKELWLNGSGYPDPTAYKAMKGMDMDRRIGEVWTVNTHKGTKTMLVVAEKDGAFALLEMFDELKPNADITVNVNGEDMHTNSIMHSYCFDGRFVDKVGTLSDEDFNMVLETVGRTFDVPMMPVTDFVRAAHDHTLKKDAEINELTARIEKLTAENAGLILDNGDLKEILEKIKETPIFPEDYDFHDATVLKTERDLYKQLYEQAFERLIAR